MTSAGGGVSRAVLDADLRDRVGISSAIWIHVEASPTDPGGHRRSLGLRRGRSARSAATPSRWHYRRRPADSLGAPSSSTLAGASCSGSC